MLCLLVAGFAHADGGTEVGGGTKETSGDVSAATAPKKVSASGRFGDVSLAVVETFGRIDVPSGTAFGKSGAMQGSGWDLRFMMPPGVGAYYRWNNAAQHDGNHVDWYLVQYAFGIAGRLHSTGRSGLWSIRTQSRIEWGFLYFQANTDDNCTRSWAPRGAECSGVSAAASASGAGIGTELRVAGEIDVGPLAISVDVGATGYRSWSSASGSASLPGWFWIPNAQLKFGLVLPFD